MDKICSIDLKTDAVTCCACAFPLPLLCEACKGKHNASAGFHFLLPISAVQVIKSQRELMQVQPRLLQLSNTYKQADALLTDFTRCEDLIESAYQDILHSAEQLKVKYQQDLLILKQSYTSLMHKAIEETSLHALEGEAYNPEDPIIQLLWEHDPRRSDVLVEFKASVGCLKRHLKKAFQVAFCTSLPSLAHLNVGQFPSSVQVCIQDPGEKVYKLEVQGSDSVRALKTKLESECGVPPDFQELIWEDQVLSDSHLLSDYDFPPDLKLSLTFLPILLIRDSAGKTWILEFSSRDNVTIVKSRIQEKLGIPIDQQRLIFAGKQLDDDRTLASYGVEKGAILHLFQRPNGDMQIFIKMRSGQLTLFDVNYNDKVETVKRKIEAKEGIPRDFQKLIFVGKLMDDRRTLADYYVQNETVLHLLQRFGIQIYVKMTTGKMLSLNVEAFDVIETLYYKIQDLEGIPPSDQKLIFAGQILDDTRTIESYGVQSEAVLELVQRLRCVIQVFVKTPGGKTLTLDVRLSDTIAGMKRMIEEWEGIKPEIQTLIFMGKRLEDDLTLDVCGIQKESTLYLSVSD